MKQPLIAFVMILVFGSCTLVDPREVIGSNQVITLENVDSISKNSKNMPEFYADSISKGLIIAKLGPKSDASKEIIFHTTAGVLTLPGQAPTTSSSSSLTVTPSDREVVIQLNALDIAQNPVIVSGSTNQVSGTLKLAFKVALASDFLVQPLSAFIGVDDILEVEILASRASGVMSENQFCEINATSADDIEINFPQFVKMSDQKGKFKIVNTSGKPGKVTLTVMLPTVSDSTTIKTITINYK